TPPTCSEPLNCALPAPLMVTTAAPEDPPAPKITPPVPEFVDPFSTTAPVPAALITVWLLLHDCPRLYCPIDNRFTLFNSSSTWLIEFSLRSPTLVLCAFCPRCSAVAHPSTSPPVKVLPSPCTKLIPKVPGVGLPLIVGQLMCSRRNALAFTQSVGAELLT